jgi:hypothetical protein
MIAAVPPTQRGLRWTSRCTRRGCRRFRGIDREQLAVGDSDAVRPSESSGTSSPSSLADSSRGIRCSGISCRARTQRRRSAPVAASSRSGYPWFGCTTTVPPALSSSSPVAPSFELFVSSPFDLRTIRLRGVTTLSFRVLLNHRALKHPTVIKGQGVPPTLRRKHYSYTAPLADCFHWFGPALSFDSAAGTGTMKPGGSWRLGLTQPCGVSSA